MHMSNYSYLFCTYSFGKLSTHECDLQLFFLLLTLFLIVVLVSCQKLREKSNINIKKEIKRKQKNKGRLKCSLQLFASIYLHFCWKVLKPYSYGGQVRSQ